MVIPIQFLCKWC